MTTSDIHSYHIDSLKSQNSKREKKQQKSQVYIAHKVLCYSIQLYDCMDSMQNEWIHHHRRSVHKNEMKNLKQQRHLLVHYLLLLLLLCTAMCQSLTMCLIVSLSTGIVISTIMSFMNDFMKFEPCTLCIFQLFVFLLQTNEKKVSARTGTTEQNTTQHDIVYSLVMLL